MNQSREVQFRMEVGVGYYFRIQFLGSRWFVSASKRFSLVRGNSRQNGFRVNPGQTRST
ncbi:hypothetical protein Hanom_Chr16g01455721 [Helianthus anomalus]